MIFEKTISHSDHRENPVQFSVLSVFSVAWVRILE